MTVDEACCHAIFAMFKNGDFHSDSTTMIVVAGEELQFVHFLKQLLAAILKSFVQ